MRNTFAQCVSEQVRGPGGDKTVFLTGDLGFSVLEPLQEVLGKRFINAGVAEAQMVSMAAGLASDGYKVITYSIVPFTTFRCLEQIRNDIAYHKLDVTVVGIGAGYGYGVLGATHHATEDFAAVWTIPNMQVFSPADVVETKLCLDRIWSLGGPKYLRLGKGGEGALSTQKFAPLSNAAVLEYQSGDALTLISTGNVLSEVLTVAKKLGESGIQAQVLSCPWVKPFPSAELISKIRSKRILIVEELNPYGGFSSVACRVLLTSGRFKDARVDVASAPDLFAETVGSAAHQRKWAGLSPEAIFERARKLLN